jgi:hypothetical protein
MRRLSILLFAALGGCGDGDHPGTVQVSWRTGALSCKEAGVKHVRAELFGYDDAEAAAAEAAPCDDRALELAGVDAGSYTLWLKGIDAAGCWTHEARQDVRVAEGGTRQVKDLALLRRRRTVDLRWPFTNELDCAGNGVEQVAVTVDVGDEYSLDEVFVCEGLHRKIEGVPAGTMRVTLTALDPRGEPLARGEATFGPEVFERAPCPDVVVEARIPLEFCNNPGCL